jgi:hypothetical protein
MESSTAQFLWRQSACVQLPKNKSELQYFQSVWSCVPLFCHMCSAVLSHVFRCSVTCVSGRYFIDQEEIIGTRSPAKIEEFTLLRSFHGNL